MYLSTTPETPSQYPRVVENPDVEDIYPTPKTSSSVSPHHYHPPPVVVVSRQNLLRTATQHAFQVTYPPSVSSLPLNPPILFPLRPLVLSHCDPHTPQT